MMHRIFSDCTAMLTFGIAMMVALPSHAQCDWLATEVDQTIEACNRLLDQNLGDTAESRSTALVIRGLAHMRKNEPGKALADYTEAIRRNPTSGAARTFRGITHWELGDDGEALADFEAAARLEPDSADVQGRRIIAQSRLRTTTACREEQESLLRLHAGGVPRKPDLETLQQNLACARLRPMVAALLRDWTEKPPTATQPVTPRPPFSPETSQPDSGRRRPTAAICAEIVERAQLGELAEDDRTFLQRECGTRKR